MMFKRASLFAAVLLASLLFSGCSEAKRDALPVPKGTVPMVIDPGSDTYENTSDEMAEIKDEPTPSTSQSSAPKPAASVAKDLCTRVGENAIEFSKIAAEESGSAFIARLLDFELVADNRDTVTLPAVDEVAVVIECRVEIELSTGDRGSVTIYELLDSDGQTRVRWDDYQPE